MIKIQDLTGKQFGRWKVLKFSHKNSKRMSYWQCKCKCGTIKNVLGTNLTSGKTLSCGCYAREQNSKNHQLMKNHNRQILYSKWQNMIRRCYDTNNQMYQRYGARGIRVCDEWLTSFEKYFEWANKTGFKKGLSIDRIDVNGNYEPLNCRWATNFEQANNKENTKKIFYMGKEKTMAEWSRELNIKYDLLKYKIRKGSSMEEIVNKKGGANV